jgi:gamma-butyrobetaine dioxygenase
MAAVDVDRSYEAMARFHTLGADPAFQIESAFVPGDAVIFDNRRMLHARSAYDPTAGMRRLRGCYFDPDDLRSTVRVLTRS